MKYAPKPRLPFASPAEKRLADRLDKWRIRGQAARTARQPRLAPALPRSIDAEIRAQIEAAWFEGYDDTRPPRPPRERER